MRSDNEDIAIGILMLIDRLSPDGAWVAPKKGAVDVSGNTVRYDDPCAVAWSIPDALFLDHPGGFVPLRGRIGCFIGEVIGDTQTTYFWENAPDRTQAEVLALLRRSYEKASA